MPFPDPVLDFAQTSQVYVAYTALPNGRLTLSRVPLGDPGREQVVLTQPHAEFSNHNGGARRVRPGRLPVLGARRRRRLRRPRQQRSAAEHPAGQDPAAGRRPVLRRRRLHCVPSDNPYVGVPGARPEIWVTGVRNAWRLSLDPADGSLWVGDVGQGTREEIDHLGQDDGGANLGWSCREGTTVFSPERRDPTRCTPTPCSSTRPLRRAAR